MLTLAFNQTFGESTMAKPGQPKTIEERRECSIKHWLHYGIKMGVRRDIGAARDIEEYGTLLAEKFVGRSYAEIGQMAASIIEERLSGIRLRQSHPIDDISERIDNIEHALTKAMFDIEKSQNTIASKANAFDGLYNTVLNAVCGTNVAKKILVPINPLDQKPAS